MAPPLTSLDPCLFAPVLGYLNDGILPPEGASCSDSSIPFPPPTARSTEASPTEPWGIDQLRRPTH